MMLEPTSISKVWWKLGFFYVVLSAIICGWIPLHIFPYLAVILSLLIITTILHGFCS